MMSVKEQRAERLLTQSEDSLGTLKDRKFVPSTIFEKNLSPSLQEPSKRNLNS